VKASRAFGRVVRLGREIAIDLREEQSTSARVNGLVSNDWMGPDFFFATGIAFSSMTLAGSSSSSAWRVANQKKD
jgi:hypothetical protein